MKFYLLYPKLPLNPCLFPILLKTFCDEGHEIVLNIADADVCLMDLHTRLADYEQGDIDYIVNNNIKVVTFDEWDRGGMSEDKWPYPLTNQQQQVSDKLVKHETPCIHFCRLLDNSEKFSNVFPYEKPILHEEPVLTKDELFNRPIDVTYIANTAPNREEIKRVFEADGRLKCNFLLGAEKLPFDKWVDENRKSKFTISASGGGYSDEKKQNLFSICAILQERTDQLLLHPFIHGETCLKFDQPPTKEDLDTIYEVANDKDRLFEIYKNGYDFMNTYYTQEYIATDILNKIIKHLG